MFHSEGAGPFTIKYVQTDFICSNLTLNKLPLLLEWWRGYKNMSYKQAIAPGRMKPDFRYGLFTLRRRLSVFSQWTVSVTALDETLDPGLLVGPLSPRPKSCLTSQTLSSDTLPSTQTQRAHRRQHAPAGSKIFWNQTPSPGDDMNEWTFKYG